MSIPEPHANTANGRHAHLIIRGGTLIDPAAGTQTLADLHLHHGCITHDPAPDDAHVLEARDCIVCPGFTDLYTRLREPGMTRKGSIDSETRAAAHAGFTRVLCAPDTAPVIDNTATVELILHRAAAAGHVEVQPMAALTQKLEGTQLAELACLRNAGCVAASNADRPIADSQVLYNAIDYAASAGLPVVLNARDAWLSADGCAHAGQHASRLGLPGISTAAETVGLARLIELCRQLRHPLHISRLSCAQSIELIRRARDDGLPITCDVGLLHLFLTDACLQSLDSVYHSAVPYRTEADRDALRAGVRDGVIDAICSDHAPHDADAKLAPFAGSEPGQSVYDVFLPLLFSLAELLPLELPILLQKVSGQSTELAASAPAPATALAPGDQPVDLVVLDPAGTSLAAAEAILSWRSHGSNSPAAGGGKATFLRFVPDQGVDRLALPECRAQIRAGRVRVL